MSATTLDAMFADGDVEIMDYFDTANYSRPNARKIDPVGKVIAEEFMQPKALTPDALAQALRVPAARLNGLLSGADALTADWDARLTKFFNLSAGYFLRWQEHIENVRATRR
jgi:addiction module HigA family antidote